MGAESGAICGLEAWREDVQSPDFDGPGAESGLGLLLRKSVGSVNVSGPVCTSKPEESVVTVVNDHINDVVTVVVEEIDGFIDFVDGTVQIFNALVQEVQSDLVAADLSLDSLGLNGNRRDLLFEVDRFLLSDLDGLFEAVDLHLDLLVGDLQVGAVGID